MSSLDQARKQTAFDLRLMGRTFKEVAQEIKVSTSTLGKWENGWLDKEGKFHPGWKEELEKLWKEQQKEFMQSGLMIKQERLKTYDRLIRAAVTKIEEQFVDIPLKTAGDVKFMLAEVRELCKLMAIETGQYNPQANGNEIPGQKTDMPMMEIEERYRKARIPVANHDNVKEVKSVDQSERREKQVKVSK